MGVYPPSDTTMTNQCTRYICGAPNRRLYDMVTQELLDYLNQPGLTTEKLFNDFSDTKGSFYNYYDSLSPDLAGSSDGEWLSWAFAGGWRNMVAAKALVNSSPSSAQEVMQVPQIGPDHYYDMFRHTLRRMINERGVCLPIFRWPLGREPLFIYNQHFVMTKRSTGEKFFVTTKEGIPYALDDDTTFFALPTIGVYTIRLAFPKYDFYNPYQAYQASELVDSAVFRKTVDITPETNCQVVDVNTGRIHFNTYENWVNKDVKFGIVRQKDSYSAHKGSPLYNKRGIKCNGDTQCNQFAFRKQEEIENAPIRTVTKPAGRTSLTLYGIPHNYPEGRLYKVLVYSDDDIVVATRAHIELSSSRAERGVRFPHYQGIGVIKRAGCVYLPGDIIRQYQQTTSNCGTFSIALAASYWEPLKYNPLKRSGKWVEDEHGDWPPWTGQGTMNDVIDDLGFSGAGKTVDSEATRNEGLAILKDLISEGIPVIVNIDEYQDTTPTTGEHYKVLIGYDDDAVLHYTKKNGDVDSTRGALYFANSGAKGRDEGNPNKFVDGIADSRRENHEDYDNVPIGNDVDSYRAFWHKWKHGGFWPVTDDLWYLAFKP